ncbi:HET-domain-containing protein [Hyaloscypha variabilis F]|uniref:HET-domain-containing protein n=1 Tax=Hyaloscypha variabilis (strain UAMH 11265 / GT02V1 / F) TaxID=1149755 RepID=A0A2J6SB44_HYAVF|nr:HET-domain-containing protein [Hyaloscypha variabilis F]
MVSPPQSSERPKYILYRDPRTSQVPAMRLLNTSTLEIEMFAGQAPGYAILSHTWDAEEVTFDDMKSLGGRRAFLSAMSRAEKPRRSYEKILHSADFARTRGFDYIWIDTCCIDKSSSAELSETINSMFQWYKGSEICYAYLADVSCYDYPTDFGGSGFSRSRWFTRGWTLQELIAPKEVIFVDKHWKPLGTRISLKQDIQRITKVAYSVLDGGSLDTITAAAKMSWASGRETTRSEDIAYCLLGLFDVNMPLLYGEGKEKAFIRLQEEFLKNSDDESIFAWCTSQEEAQEKPYWSLLASTPNHFEHCRDFRKPRFASRREGQPTMITNRGIRVEMSLAPFRGDASGTIFLAVLECLQQTGVWSGTAAIILQRLSDLEVQYARIAPEVLLEVGMGLFRPPLTSFSEAFRNQREAAESEPMSGIGETEPHYLFIRLAPKPSGLITGFYIEPKVNVRSTVMQISLSASGANPPPGWQLDPRYSLLVFDPEPPWSRWGETEALAYHMIDFEGQFTNEELEQFEVSNVKERKVLGCMGLRITPKFTNKTPTPNWTVYFVVGLEPLPENPFGTPSGYVKPWYSFARGDNAATIFQGFKQSVPPESKKYLRLTTKQTLSINFTKGTRFSRVFYQVNLLLSYSTEGQFGTYPSFSKARIEINSEGVTQ